MPEAQVNDALIDAEAPEEQCEADSFREWLRGEIAALLNEAESIDVTRANPEHRGVFRRLYQELLRRTKPMTDDQWTRFQEIETRHQQYQAIFKADDALYFAYERLTRAQEGDEREWSAIAQQISAIGKMHGLTNDQHERVTRLKEVTESHFPHVAQRIANKPTVRDDPTWFAGVPQ